MGNCLPPSWVTHPQPKRWSVCAQGNVRDVNKNNKNCFSEISGASQGLGSGVFQGFFCCLAQGMRPRSTSSCQLLLSDAKIAPRKWFEMCRQEKGAGSSWERGGSVLLIECHLLAPHPCHCLPRDSVGEVGDTVGAQPEGMERRGSLCSFSHALPVPYRAGGAQHPCRGCHIPT